jgi:hypothetical protein
LGNLRAWIRLLVVFWLFVPAAHAEEGTQHWRLAEDRTEDGEQIIIFVETVRTVGRPAFKIETAFDATPYAAATTLMQGMLRETDLPKGHERKILESSEREAVVHTSIDLPLMFADREVALRVVHTDDSQTGVHRVEWHEDNDVLPEARDGVVRLFGTRGYWEFRPDGAQRTRATYMTQAETGGSIPNALGNRLMKAQAIDSVARLRGQLEERNRTHVASGPRSDDEAER